MWKCPVCDQENNTPFCPRCGFDRSRDWENLPTLGAMSGTPEASSRMRQERQGCAICPGCGSTAFSMDSQSGTLRCHNCGMVSSNTSVPVKKQITAIAAGDEHTVALYSDGTVRAVGRNNCGQCNTESWRNIVAIGAGFQMTVGIRKDGKAVVTGNDTDGKSYVYTLSNLAAVDGGCGGHTACLHKNGRVVVLGRNTNGQCNVSTWHDVIQVAAGFAHTVGLKRDGTVFATGVNVGGCCLTDIWTQVVQVAAGSGHTLGLKRDGTVVAVGETVDGKCDVSDWAGMIGVAAGINFSAGLRWDGTVAVATGYSPVKNAECWTDVTAICAGNEHLVAIRSDGMLMAAGRNDDGQCDVHKLCI